jgi:putative Mg2+ transporter-C (MgtC) family protein
MPGNSPDRLGVSRLAPVPPPHTTSACAAALCFLADSEITYLFRIVALADQEAHMRALFLNSIGAQHLLLKSLKSDDLEHADKVEIQAILTSTGRQNSLLEQIASRLSLEPGMTGVSWEILAENE